MYRNLLMTTVMYVYLCTDTYLTLCKVPCLLILKYMSFLTKFIIHKTRDSSEMTRIYLQFRSQFYLRKVGKGAALFVVFKIHILIIALFMYIPKGPKRKQTWVSELPTLDKKVEILDKCRKTSPY